MQVNYNKLFKVLGEKGLKKTELIEKAGVTTNIIAKLGKQEPISMDSLQKICVALDCDVGDLISLNEKNGGKQNG